MDAKLPTDSGLLSLLMIASYHGIAADPAMLQHEFGQEVFSTEKILLAAKHLGMKARVIQQDPARLDRAPLPAIAIDHEGYYFIAAKFDAGRGASPKILIQRPGNPPEVLKLQDFLDHWSGQLILFTSRAVTPGRLPSSTSPGSFPPSSSTASCWAKCCSSRSCCSSFALVTPLFFQVVMDKVLVHHAMTTLNVIADRPALCDRRSRSCSPAFAPMSSPTPAAGSTWNWARGCSGIC